MRFIDTLADGIELLQKRIKEFTSNRPKFVASWDQIDDDTFSMEYSTIKLPYPAKSVQCYYSKDGISWYHRIMDDYDRFTAPPKKEDSIELIFRELHLYVSEWNSEKIIMMADITNLSKRIERVARKINGERLRVASHANLYKESNTPETFLMDRVNIRFKNPTDTVSYKRIYFIYFGKKRISTAHMINRIGWSIKLLDRLALCVDMLMAGYDKIGKDESFEKYKARQHVLLYAAQKMADLLEAEILLCEDFIEVAQIPIHVKLYPDMK